MDCKRIVNGYEWICIRLRHFVILHKTSCTRQFESTLSLRSFALSLQLLSATQLTKRIIINFKNFQSNETKSQSHQVRRTAAKQIGYVSVSYRFRIDLVSIPYRSRIVLLSFSLPEAETIRKRYGNHRISKGGTREKVLNSKHFQIFKTLQLWQDSMVS